jgi:hypothetical protein
MKCPKCGKTMNEGYRFNLSQKGPAPKHWFCSDWKGCKYEMPFVQK